MRSESVTWNLHRTANFAIVTRHLGRVVALIVIAVGVFALAAAAQSASEVKGATPLVGVPNEPPAKLVVDPITGVQRRTP